MGEPSLQTACRGGGGGREAVKREVEDGAVGPACVRSLGLLALQGGGLARQRVGGCKALLKGKLGEARAGRAEQAEQGQKEQRRGRAL